MDFQLAQINIGRLLAPIGDPQIAGFVGQLDEMNKLAEESRGFVWRLQSDSGNATNIPYNSDPLTIVNISVWESIEALQTYTYQSKHVRTLRDRKNWFERHTSPHYCLWWIPAGHIPSVSEGRERLEHYCIHGSTPEAFWFSEPFPAEASLLQLQR